MNNDAYICNICNKPFKKSNALSSHLKYIHNISSHEYYDKYIKQENDGICKMCECDTKFINIANGYKKYCNKCTNIIRANTYKENCIKKYGVSNTSKLTSVKQKISNTLKNPEKQQQIKQHFINTIGVDNPMKNDEIKEKVKQTCIEKYGVDNVFKSDGIKQQIKCILIKKYGVDNISKSNEIKEKKKQTTLKHYNVDIPLKSNEIKEKQIQTNLDRYGVSNPMQNKNIQEKAKQTYYDKTGYYYPAQNPTIKQILSDSNKKYWQNITINEYNNRLLNQRNSFIEKYGVDNVFKSDEIKQQIKNTLIEKYGSEYYSQSNDYKSKIPQIQQKVYETKKKNNSFHSTHIEQQFIKYLISNNHTFEYQYKSNKYPFNCDFYLPIFDLYIEINGYWTHGKHPFDKTNEKDIQILNNWKRLSIYKPQYKAAIDVWADRDILKINIAKQNNLNYLVIYSSNIGKIINEFEIYIKTIKTGFYTA